MRDAFAPVLRQSLSDKLAQRIRAMIRKGDYQQGDRLPPIMEMARRFGVGHPTIREALKKLETMGIELDKIETGPDREAAAVMALIIDWAEEQFRQLARRDARDLLRSGSVGGGAVAEEYHGVGCGEAGDGC